MRKQYTRNENWWTALIMPPSRGQREPLLALTNGWICGWLGKSAWRYADNEMPPSPIARGHSFWASLSRALARSGRESLPSGPDRHRRVRRERHTDLNRRLHRRTLQPQGPVHGEP